MKRTLLITSLAALAVVLFAAWRDDESTEYVRHQRAYAAYLAARGQPVELPVRIRQLVLPEMGRIDRCITCHVGMEDPRLADAPKPIRAHPGTFLSDHNVQKVGCTVCHDGQGRATIRRDAHANMFRYWEAKRLPGGAVQATCTRCHSEDSPSMMPLFVRGRELFRASGCLGCHKLRGKGGHLGPDLTAVGAASPHLKMPTPEAREALLERFGGNVNLAYIYESIRRPKAQPTGSKMFDYGLSDEEAFAMAVYIKSFAPSPVPPPLHAAHDVVHEPTGAQLYATYCSACHGPDGMGTRKAELGQIGPAVANENFLAIAEPEFIYYKVFHSGSDTMPAWGTAGGFTGQEVRRVSEFLLTRRAQPPSPGELAEYEGSARMGSVLFAAKCSGCHGIEGSHETDLVGPTLDSPEFLSYATREMLSRTLLEGRPHTAMPSWYFLPARDLADLLAYFRARRGEPPRLEEALKHMKDARAAAWGRAKFRGLCATCHGADASGALGPSLVSGEFQLLASDAFLFRTITHGRRGTAMGRWAHLSAEETGWLLAFLRSGGTKGAVRHFQDAEVVASETRGRRSFARVCAQCHGPEGAGYIAPAVGNPDFLAVAGDAFIKETVAFGRGGTGMKGALGEQGGIVSFTEREIDEVTAYLRSLAARDGAIRRTETQGDVSLGRDRFERTCAQCHGPAGSGGKGPAIGRAGLLGQVGDGFLEGTVANGRSGTEMKGFARGADGLVEMSEHEIRSVVRYVRSGADAGRLRRKVVDGTPAEGGRLYGRFCSQCHGTWTAKGFAPRLTNRVFLEAASNSYLQATMSLGRHGSAMRSMMRGGGGVVEMTSRQVNDVISYLRYSAARRDSERRK